MIYSTLALGYALVWNQLAAERPDECRYLGESEKAYLAATLAAKKSPDSQVNSGMLDGLRFVRLWAIYASHFVFNYGVYFVNSWSATYYLDTFSLRPERAGLHLALPHMTNMVVKVLVNPTMEKALRAQGFNDLGCRKTFTVLGFMIPAGCFLVAPFIREAILSTLVFSLALGAMAFHPSGFKANYMDVSSTSGGLISGIGNTVASAASSIGPLVVAHLNESSGSWRMSFTSVAVLDIAAAGVFFAFASTTPIENERVGSTPEVPLQDKAK